MLGAEIDILVPKLLNFETFTNFLRVSVSVSENLVSEKKYRFRLGKGAENQNGNLRWHLP